MMKVASKIERLIDAEAVVVWRPVKDYAGLYEVSNEGDVKSLARADSNNHPVKERILKPGNNGRGYLQVHLFKDTQQKQYYIHRLVMEVFIGPCPKGMEVNHRDEDPTNNSVSNLEYVTHKQNMNHGTCNARQAAKIRGEKNYTKRPEARRAMSKRFKNNPELNPNPPKPVEAIDPQTGNRIYYFESINAAGRAGFITGAISNCCLGKRRTHRGLIWRFAKLEPDQTE